MTYSNTIPANVIPYVRAGSLAELADAGAKLTEAHGQVLAERHLREIAPIVDRYKAHSDLVDLIGWGEEENAEAVEMDPNGNHLWAIREALERFARDRPGVGAAEIEAFCLDVGLRFKSGGA